MTCNCKKYRNPTPTTDAVIYHKTKDKEGLVLITRDKAPYQGCLALPGGFHEEGITSLENVKKEAMEETNLEIMVENPRQPYIYDNPARDPRGHIKTDVYYATGYGQLKAGDDAKEVHLKTIDEVLGMFGKQMLAFDHEDILKDYMRQKGYL